MIQAFLRLVENALGGRIEAFAHKLHLFALVLLILAWTMPFLLSYRRRWRERYNSRLVQMVQCRACGHYNPMQETACQNCAKPLHRGAWWKRAVPAPVRDLLRRSGRSAVGFYRLTGWTLFYLVTLAAVAGLRFYSFSMKPLQELFASAAVLLLLLSVFFIGRSFRTQWESPVSRLLNFFSGIGVAGFFFLAAFCWAMAPYAPGKPLAVLKVEPDGRIHVTKPSGSTVTAQAEQKDGVAQCRLQYAVLTWPLAGLHNTFLVRVAGKPVMGRGGRVFVDSAAGRFREDRFYVPRVVVLDQVFPRLPPGVFHVREPEDGTGLALELQP
jgi:hypothetical protein